MHSYISDRLDTRIIFAQGWAMLPTIWAPLITHLKHRLPSMLIQLFDRYAQQINSNSLDSTHYIWVSHSFGCMQLWTNSIVREQINKKCIAAISIQGFTHLPENGSHASLAKDNLRNMLHGLATCLLYTSPSPRDLSTSRMPSSA